MNPTVLSASFPVNMSRATGEWMADALEYLTDATQRSILYLDILRKRGNIYLEHLEAGQPPVLIFPYQIIMNGREMARPVNYALVKIFDRRTHDKVDMGDGKTFVKPKPDPDRLPRVEPDSRRRPIVVIDPRAGHGPGIGGSKLDSQIGVAIDYGYPVYFVLFFTDPEPGQTLADVQRAEVRFLEAVSARHPDAEKPAVIGNCQAGWATALIGADRPDVVGPMVFNGSPLSYWGGVRGANPMRYRGGLLGGTWLTSFLCDLGNGRFDGANLVAGFEDLNPANTLWNKWYNVYAKADTEERRFLDFEKWWGGFFRMNTEEIHFIVDSLFVGNELEQGYLLLEEGRVINLKNFKDPIVVFASSGDNITPPQQALNWIVKVYGTVDEIKRNGQVIVYLVHEKIGHLGIFVSSSVARREHRAIIGNVELIEYLSPGLYEMVIEDEPSKPWLNDHKVAFVEREMSDIMVLDDGLEDEAAFRPVTAMSRFNDKIYRTFFSPWVRLMSNSATAYALEQSHPLRYKRYMISDMNPAVRPVGHWAEAIKRNRRPVSEDNRFLRAERTASQTITAALDAYRDLRDTVQEYFFRSIYDNTWMKTLFPEPKRMTDPLKIQMAGKPLEAVEADLWRETMQKGGFADAVVRIIVAVAGANRSLDKRQWEVAEKIVLSNGRLRKISPSDYKRMVKEQSAIVNKDRELAIATLPFLLPERDDRVEAFEIANSIATADMNLDVAEQETLSAIEAVLGV